MKIAVLASGRGSHLKNLIDKEFNIEILITNKLDCGARDIAEENSIENIYIDLSKNKDQKIVEEIESRNCDLIVLAGFMKILSPEFVKKFPNRILNIHPSLLPSFPGINAQKQAFDYGVKYSGCTAHYVDEGVDTGPIIMQSVVNRYDNDTLEEFSDRILMEEHKIYPEAIKIAYQKISGKKIPLTYKDAGVDVLSADKLVKDIKNLVSTTHNSDIQKSRTGYAGVFKLSKKYKGSDYLAATCDGVGTKILLAKKIKRYECLGIDLVAMNVNDLIAEGAEPMVFMDYIATGKINNSFIKDIIRGMVIGCKRAKCALVGGETAEMPDMYGDGEIDLAGFAVGRVSWNYRGHQFGSDKIAAGDQVIGIPSNGVHSNGFSLIRKVLRQEDYENRPLMDELLKPTRIYVKAFNWITARDNLEVKAFAHITGGGLYGRTKALLPSHCNMEINLYSFDIPKIFEAIQSNGNISEKEMMNTFNMGIGFIAIVKKSAVFRLTKSNDSEWIHIGEIVEGNKEVVFKRELK